MDIGSLFYALGASGFFSSRAFIPAFLSSVALRFGEHLPFLSSVEFIQTTGSEPTWFTSMPTMAALGALSLLEVGATKVPEAQELLAGVHKYAKSGVAALSTMGVLSSTDVGFIEQTISQANIFDTVLSGGVAVAVYFISTLRNGFFELLSDADADDDLGLQRLISWFEDIWASFGIYFFFVYPLVILGILGAIIGFLFGCKKWAERKEEQSKVPCTNCEEPMYGCALACPKCKTPNPNPKSIGFFGQTVDKAAPDSEIHETRLASKRRCTLCASKVEKRKLPQSCENCGKELFGTKEERDRYLSRIRGRLPKVLGIGFLLSLIPVLGIIPGIIYYRIQLVAPFRAYIPASRGFALKWLIRLIFFILISVQLVPGVGGLVVPVMALISYTLYKGYFVSMLNEPSESEKA